MRRLPLAGIAVAVLFLVSAARAGPPRPLTDAEIRERIASVGETKDHGGAAVVVVAEEADVRVLPSGLATTDDLRVVKILKASAIKSHAVLREGFDPATNRVAIRSVRIHRKGGEVEEVPCTPITQPSKQWMIFWGGRQHLVDVPRLAVGDALELRTSRVGFNIAYLEDGSGGADLDATGLEPPMPGHWHETVRFSGGSPIQYKRYSVHMPPGKTLQFGVFGGDLRTSVLRDGDHYVYTFLAENVPAFKGEPSMVSRDDVVTKVVMATLETWEEKSRWFHGVNETQFEADEAIREKVAEVTEGLRHEDEQIAACLHWVADNIRYYGTSRGPCEGFTLHTGIETFHDKGGVCKDIAGMLITMLRVLGHEAYPALTMAGPRVEDVPADQFNHTVCVVRHRDGSYQILDPTWSPVSRELWSSREARQGLVYGTPEGEKLTLSPHYPPEHNLLRARADWKLDDAGKLSGGMRFDLKGYPCTYFRRYVNRSVPARRQQGFESVLGIAPNARITKLDYTDPLDYSRDSMAEISVEAPGYLAGGNGLRFFRLPLLSHPLGRWLMGDLLSPPKGKDRKFPLRLRASRLVEYEEAIELPEGFRVAKLPKKVSLDSPAVSLEFAAKTEGRTLRWTLRFAAKSHVVPPEEFAVFQKALGEVKRLADEWILLVPKEVADAK